ncbi:hypothetical protein IAE22_27740, partial [Bacillus sp. S34]|nr:hypothetical protein [Bacillus sp. S34]
MGGSGNGTNPEQLFAAGYAAVQASDPPLYQTSRSFVDDVPDVAALLRAARSYVVDGNAQAAIVLTERALHIGGGTEDEHVALLGGPVFLAYAAGWALLPDFVAELDPTRPYTPGSPFSFDEYLTPNDERNGSVHIWDVWNRLPDTAYRASVPRFVSEFGWQAPPAWRTLRDAVRDAPLAVDSPGVVHHQKAADGMGKLARGIAPRFGSPDLVAKPWLRWTFVVCAVLGQPVLVAVLWLL